MNQDLKNSFELVTRGILATLDEGRVPDPELTRAIVDLGQCLWDTGAASAARERCNNALRALEAAQLAATKAAQRAVTNATDRQSLPPHNSKSEREAIAG